MTRNKFKAYLRNCLICTGAIPLAAILLIVGCTPTTKPLPPATIVIAGCEHFKLITASRKDTAETKEQILAHDLEYQKVCGKTP